MGSKVCTKCRKEKSLDNFPVDRQRKGGLHYWCKDCKQIIDRDYRTNPRNNPKLPDALFGGKVCPKCKQEKQLDQYYKSCRTKDGVNWYCKPCTQENTKSSKMKLNVRVKADVASKTCRRCKQERLIIYFTNYIRSKDGYDSLCTICKSSKEYRDLVIRSERNYRGRNQERINVISQNRRSAKRGNGGTHTFEEWQLLKEKYSNTCLKCGRKEPEIKLTEDHVLPLYWGGANKITNIQPLCTSCNCSKNNKYMDFRPDSPTYGEGWKQPSLWS